MQHGNIQLHSRGLRCKPQRKGGDAPCMRMPSYGQVERSSTWRCGRLWSAGSSRPSCPATCCDWHGHVTQVELSSLNDRMKTMRDELVVFTNVDGLREQAEARKKMLKKQREVPLGSPLPRLHWDWAHSLPHLHRDWARPYPHLHRDWHRCSRSSATRSSCKWRNSPQSAPASFSIRVPQRART